MVTTGDPRVDLASKLMEKGRAAASSDIYVARWQGLRGTKKKPLPPVDHELHVNPVSLALAGLAGVVGLTLAVGQIRIPKPLGGSVTLYRGPLRDEWIAVTTRDPDDGVSTPSYERKAEAVAAARVECRELGWIRSRACEWAVALPGILGGDEAP